MGATHSLYYVKLARLGGTNGECSICGSYTFFYRYILTPRQQKRWGWEWADVWGGSGGKRLNAIRM